MRQNDARLMFSYVDKGQRDLARARMALRNFAGGVDAAISRIPVQLINSPGLVYERVRWRRHKGKDASARELLLSPYEASGISPGGAPCPCRLASF